MAIRRVQENSAQQDGDLVFDAHRHTPVQIARWTEQRTSVTFTGTSARLTLPSGSLLVEISASENCFLNFGNGSVNATAVIATDESRLFLAGVQNVVVPIDGSGDPFTHVAVIQQTVAGLIQVEQVE